MTRAIIGVKSTDAWSESKLKLTMPAPPKCMDSDEHHHAARARSVSRKRDDDDGHSSSRNRSRRKWWLAATVVLAVALALTFRWRTSREHSQDPVILEAAVRYNIHPALIKAVVWRESWFDPHARGTSGEIGLMQIRTPTAQDWAAAEKNKSFSDSQLFEPAKNTQCGAWYLRRLLNRYRATDNPLVYALAAYNAGPANVGRWSKGEGATNGTAMLRQMDFPGTRRYVVSVAKRYVFYRRTFPPRDWLPNGRAPLIEKDKSAINHGLTL